jgi:PIN domain nuclease of toxin-antitoxin system
LRLLLDTHVAVWSVSSSGRLTPAVVEMLAEPGNEVYVSVVSIWEIALKNGTGRRDQLPFSAAVAAFRFTEFGYTSLGLEVPHILRQETLPDLHRDPFDRLLLAQALVARLQLVTHDGALAAYDPTIITF